MIYCFNKQGDKQVISTGDGEIDCKFNKYRKALYKDNYTSNNGIKYY